MSDEHASEAVRTFQRIVAGLDYPMFVVTAFDGRERAGCLVGFATQCSIHPPRFLVGISRKNRTFEVASRSDTLAVHVLRTGDEPLAALFGGETGDEIDKFTRCAWTEGPGGVPLLDESDSWLAGPVVARHDLGDHVGFVIEPEVARKGGSDPTLQFPDVKHIEPGHQP